MKLVRLLALIFILSCCFRVLACSQVKHLPDSKFILPQIKNEPVQTTQADKPYKFSYAGSDYLVEPVADYELYGLVVTHNNINSLSDIYHDKKSVDIKDLCVLWGDNVRTNDYQKIDFSSNAFVCNFSTNDSEVFDRFNQFQISNNHILSQSEAVRSKINSIAIGDQIYLKGQLVNYRKQGEGFIRKSSLTRTDTGNGACEVFMVNQVNILNRGNLFWNRVKAFSGYLAIILAVLTPLTFLYAVFAEQKKLYGHLKR